METNNLLVVLSAAIPMILIVIAGFYMKYKWSLMTKILGMVFMIMALTGVLGMWMGMNDFSMAVNLIALVGLCLGVTGLAIFLGPLILTKPIQDLQKVMEDMAETGDMSLRATVTSSDEVGKMASSLNNMLDDMIGPVTALSELAVTIASGDLTVDTEMESKGDVSKLVNSFKKMVEGLQKAEKLEKDGKAKDEAIVAEKRVFANELAKKAQLFASNAEEMSASSEEVTASAQEMATVIQQITNGSQVVATKVDELLKQNEEANRITVDGAESARSVGEKMTEITETISQSAEAIEELGTASREIVKIIDVIRSISEQTNMLALNAAVEAARAGDAGRGFAVVAEEVGKLAGKSAESTEKIEEVINNMRNKIGTAVKGMDNNSRMVDESGKVIQEAVKSFEEIPILIEQMNTAIEAMAGAAQDNAAGAEESAATVEELTSSMENVAQSAQDLLRASNDLNDMTKTMLEAKV